MSNGGWGGKREGAGAKPPGYVAPQARLDFEEERALHEKVKREQREFKLAQERGEFIARESYRQANAALLAMVTQSLRSIPDNLERSLALQPEIVDAVAKQIDAVLADLANGLRATTGDPQ